MNALPHSEACERNKGPIADALHSLVTENTSVLEVGSGTGQHVQHFAQTFPETTWQPSDIDPENSGVSQRVALSRLANLREPIRLRVGSPASESRYEGVFTANTLHIMDEHSAHTFFSWIRDFGRPQSWLAVYGPFNDDGRFTSEGDRSLDAWARATFPGAGLRNIQSVLAWAQEAGWSDVGKRVMPANNLLLTFRLE